MTAQYIKPYSRFVRDHREKMLQSEYSGNGAEHKEGKHLEREIPVTRCVELSKLLPLF